MTNIMPIKRATQKKWTNSQKYTIISILNWEETENINGPITRWNWIINLNKQTNKQTNSKQTKVQAQMASQVNSNKYLEES